jgi:aspartyl aminopeptidase
MLNDAGVPWQVHAYRAGYGGGTIAQWFANADIDTIDVGIGILSMHSPMEIAAKVDIWELYRGFSAFWNTSARPGASTADR